MVPIHRKSFKDVYLVYELMDTDLHQIINLLNHLVMTTAISSKFRSKLFINDPAGLAIKTLAGVISLASSEIDQSMIGTLKNDISKLLNEIIFLSKLCVWNAQE
ncbi:hypothetical protein G4B88_018384 [Cannabis sativa]|uniref:Uncharacterized protein n=1 Tax=Cannabis sativa TaxID=3483 RepID=A0A7J6E061_CANSA|nr:hypothetical protein G4B88_018384 [Cannabis sativa]